MTANRWAALAGIIAAIALVAGLMTVGGDFVTEDSDEDIISAIEDSANIQVVGVYLGAVAALALVAFAAVGLKPRLKAASRNDGDRGLAAVVLPAFIFVGVCIALGHVSLGSVAASNLFDDAPVDPGAARALWHFGYGAMLVAGGLGTALGVGATSAHALRTGSLPKWFGWFGLFVTVCMLAAVIFVPFLLVPIWLVVCSIVISRAGQTSA